MKKMAKNKNLEFGLEGRNKIRDGVNKLASAVGSTLGPSGRNVIIEQENGAPVVTKDGVSVAKEIKLKDPIENIGAEVLKEVSMRAAKKAGDGTTTATVLAASMYNEGLKAVMAGLNVVEVKRGMDAATAQIIDQIQDSIHPSDPANMRAAAEQIEDLYCADLVIDDSDGAVFVLRQLMLIADELERGAS